MLFPFLKSWSAVVDKADKSSADVKDKSDKKDSKKKGRTQKASKEKEDKVTEEKGTADGHTTQEPLVVENPDIPMWPTFFVFAGRNLGGIFSFGGFWVALYDELTLVVSHRNTQTVPRTLPLKMRC